MTKKRLRRVMALVMALVLTVGAVLPTAAYANATGPDADVAGSDRDSQAEVDQEPVLYNETDRPDLEPAEIAAAEDIIVAAGYGFDVEQSFDGISYDDKAVKVSYYAKQGSFDGDKEGDYATYYKAEPVSGKTPYLICRTISVREPETAVEESRESGSGQSETGEESNGEEEPAPGDKGMQVSPSDGALKQEKPAYEETGGQSLLSEGEMETFSAGDTMMIRMASAPVLKAAANPSSKDSMKVSCSGYAKYCGHSMGIKYISESGDYHNHLVYCLNLNKNTTNGTVGASGSKSSIKPEITFCMVNGARKLNGICHNSKYSAGSASADYFITGASIHVLNGEVKLSYYNNGSSVYKKIAAMVADAKNYDEDEYDAATGVTKSITYKISPKKTEWQDMGDGLYRSKEKFVRTKTGSITDVSYKITGQPNGLTVGELKTDASDIEDDSDLKKYDICVAQTDADKASSNFYLYCNGEAMEKIVAADSTIKLTATAKSKENGGRKWTPTVVSQQKITFLEEFEPGTVTASVKVVSKFKEGRFELHKTNVYNGRPVPGATYYLYEDAECTDLLCKLGRTNTDGQALSGKETLTQSTYYLKEVKEASGYQRDETVYPVGLEYFTLYDSDGKVTQQGKKMEVVEYPDTVGVMVVKTDSESGNFVKGAGFAVFTDAGCTNRVSVDGDGKTEVPVFYYDEDLDAAASEKFVKTQDKYYVKEVVIPDGYRDDGKVWEVTPDYGEISDFSAENTPIRCDVAAKKEDKETGAEPQGDAKLSGATYGLYAAETIVYPDGRGTVAYAGDDNITSSQGTDFVSTGVPAEKDALLATVKTGEQAEFNFGNLYFGNYYIREIEATLSYAEIKAVATGNPMIKEKMQIDNDVQRLKMLKATYDSQHYAMQDSFMVKFPKLIAAAEEKLRCVHEDVRERDKRLVAGANFSIKVGGMTFAERVDGGTAFLSAASKCKTGTTTEVAEYKGFSVLVEKNFMGADYLVLRGKTEYKTDLSTSPVGCMTKLENLFNGIQEKIGFLEERLEKYRLDMEQAKAEYEKPFQYGEELKEKLARQFELNNLLDMENRKSPEEEQSLDNQNPQMQNPEEQIPHVAEQPYRYGEGREENR